MSFQLGKENNKLKFKFNSTSKSDQKTPRKLFRQKKMLKENLFVIIYFLVVCVVYGNVAIYYYYQLNSTINCFNF